MPKDHTHDTENPSEPTEIDEKGGGDTITPAELAETVFQEGIKNEPQMEGLGEFLEGIGFATKLDTGEWQMTSLGRALAEAAAALYLNAEPITQPLNTHQRLIDYVDWHYPEDMADTEKHRLFHEHADDIIAACARFPIHARHMAADGLIRALWDTLPTSFQ